MDYKQFVVGTKSCAEEELACVDKKGRNVLFVNTEYETENGNSGKIKNVQKTRTRAMGTLTDRYLCPTDPLLAWLRVRYYRTTSREQDLLSSVDDIFMPLNT